MALAYRRHLVTLAFVIAALISWGAAGALAWFSYDVTMRLPGPQAITGIGDMAQRTTIYDAADRPVFTVFKEQRIEIPLEEMSPLLRKAVIAVEDQRFYEHSGIDVIRVGAAFLNNVREGRRAEGGSTITQQLARQSFLTRDKTLRRKLKEVVLASRLEHTYSKDRILELYLNKVYFGDGLYGAEAASRGFFGRPARDLGLAEAALLAGVIQSPSAYAPTINLERATSRRNVVLQAMLSTGAITRAEYEQARAAKVALKNGLQLEERFGLYFKEQVRRQLVEKFGWQRVYQGGLKVYTTLDSELQQAAEELLEEELAEIERHRSFAERPRAELVEAAATGESVTPDYLQGALIAIDPRTGHVPVMVGGRDFKDSPFNRAVQARRQPGSAFKPFVFAAALENGYSPASLITNLDDPVLTTEGEWTPEDGHSTASSMTLRAALRTSSNRAAVQLLRQVGIPTAVSYAQKLEVGTPPSVPSLALGAGVVTLESLTAAYAAFANGGEVRRTVLIRRVEDSDGNVLAEHKNEPRRAVGEATAFLMADMLADVVNAGTGYRARREGFLLPAAGKTGTTNDFFDAWFVGFTPSLVAGVWVGFDRPRTIVPDGYAGDLAVPLWARFMKAATRGAKPEWLNRPKDVVAVNICRLSGKLPNDGCGNVPVETADGFVESRSLIYTEYFRRGTQPATVCPLHPERSFMDRLAGFFGAGGQQKPVDASEVGLPTGAPPAPVGPPPVAAATSGSPAPGAETVKPEEPKKKRGFWSRLFGRGDDKDDKKKKEDEKKKEPPRTPGG
ncbi:MAG TPA: PBP1A family penicillin-binding protein [Vicinamibacterales bacterium]|nr:PBP1A family penicillin-binding protein [Vicinamibacterales bacterium]